MYSRPRRGNNKTATIHEWLPESSLERIQSQQSGRDRRNAEAPKETERQCDLIRIIERATGGRRPLQEAASLHIVLLRIYFIRESNTDHQQKNRRHTHTGSKKDPHCCRTDAVNDKFNDRCALKRAQMNDTRWTRFPAQAVWEKNILHIGCQTVGK